MRKYDKVVPATSGQIGEIAGALIGEMNFSKGEATAILGKLGTFRKDVRGFYSQFRNKAEDFSSNLLRWETNYEKLFGQNPNLSEIRIPEKPEGVGPMRLIVVVREILDWTNNHPLQGTQGALKKHFPCWQYANDLDQEITVNDRDPKNGSYAVWVKDVRETDEDLAGLSADDLAEKKIPGIITLERQLLEADYFFENGEHLDQQNITLCSGSRNRDGGVPNASCDADGFSVCWYDSSNRDPVLRSRRVWA
ncbi:MAG: hypothetical protein Q7R89_02675 [bacterium]|nr:hypothetical protein [bacterium]